MGLEYRNGHPYYYQKVRVGRRVVSRYLGSGMIAETFATLDEQERKDKAQKTAQKKAQEQRMIDESEDEERAFDALASMCDALAKASLICAGYHTHKRQWRLIRGGKK